MPALVFYPGILLPVVTPLDSGTNPVSSSAVSTFNVFETITNNISSSFNVEKTISAQVISTFNLRGNVTIITPFQLQGYLPRPVSWPIDYRRFVPSYAWNVYDPVQASKLSSFGVIQTRSAQKLSYFNVSSSNVHGSVTSRFNVLGLVQAQTINGATWNTRQTVIAVKNSRFNDLISASVQKLSMFNTNGILVTPSVTSSWNLKKQVTPSVVSSWQLAARRSAVKLSTFETLFGLSAAKTVRFSDLKSVSAQSVSSQWNLKKQVSPVILSKWDVRIRPAVNSNQMTWRVYEQVTAQKQSNFRVGINPNGPVTPHVLIEFNDLMAAHASKLSEWNTIGREGFSVLSEFNVHSSVTVSISSSFNVGPYVNNHIRQLAQERIDFAY